MNKLKVEVKVETLCTFPALAVHRNRKQRPMRTTEKIVTAAAVKVKAKVKVKVKVKQVKGEQGESEGEGGNFYVLSLRFPCIERKSKGICKPKRKS